MEGVLLANDSGRAADHLSSSAELASVLRRVAFQTVARGELREFGPHDHPVALAICVVGNVELEAPRGAAVAPAGGRWRQENAGGEDRRNTILRVDTSGTRGYSPATEREAYLCGKFGF